MKRTPGMLGLAELAGVGVLSLYLSQGTTADVSRDDQCKLLGLMTPAEAQTTSVIRIPGFLSEDEADFVRRECEAMRGDGVVGTLERGERGVPKLDGVWQTCYLHTDHVFQRRMPDLTLKMRAAMEEADRIEWGTIKNLDGVNFRTIEMHRYMPGATLSDPHHYDAGSLVTMDIMLSSGFQGGELITDGAPNTFEKGDALIFVSHKRHNVSPVRRGERVVLVAELWQGAAKTCAHRCLIAGDCSYTLARAQLANVGRNVAMLG